MYLIDGAKALITDDEHTKDKLEKVFLKTKKNFRKKTGIPSRLASFQRRNATRYISLFGSWKEIKVETKYESFRILKFQKLLCQNSKIGEI